MPTLRTAMLTEVELRMDDLAFTRKADYLSLFPPKEPFPTWLHSRLSRAGSTRSLSY
jgi:hypothetical protein